MMKKALPLLACVLMTGFSQEAISADKAESATVINAYLVGNSLVRSITPTRLHELMAEEGIDFQFGSQLKGGFSLARHWEELEKGTTLRYWESNKLVDGNFEPGRPDGDILPKRFGSYRAAHKNHKWDVLVLQPLFGGDRKKELEAFRRFVNYSIEHKSAKQIYIYTSWLRRPVLRDKNGRLSGLGSIDFQAVWERRYDRANRRGGGIPSAVRKDYREFVETVNEEFADKLGKPILMIPFGDVICELDKRLKAGRIPGLDELYKRDPQRIPSWDPKSGAKAGANILYADRSHPVAAPHLDGTIANYVIGLMYYSVLTGKSPIGLGGEAYDFGDEEDEELRKALQTTVWDVVRDHPHTGVRQRMDGNSPPRAPKEQRKKRRTGSRNVRTSRATTENASQGRELPASPIAFGSTAKGGSVSIARWKDDKTAAVTIFSSDGMIRSIKSKWTPMNPDVPYDGFHKLGREYSIPFTFFLPPRALDQRDYQPASGVTPAAQPAGTMGTWADWKFMHEAGHEIASHTYSHADLRPDPKDPSKTRSGADPEYELRQAIISIENGIGVRPISINPAYGPPAGELAVLFRKYYPVVRGDDDAEQVLVQHRDTSTADELIGRLNLAIDENKWLLVAGHGIRTALGREAEADPNFRKNGKRRDGYKPVEYPVMEALCKAVDRQRDKLFVGCYGDVGRYVREREAARIEIIRETEGEVVLEVTHSLDPKVFDYPLTLKLSLNGPADLAEMFQDGRSVEVTTRGRELMSDIVPNGGDVTIKFD